MDAREMAKEKWNHVAKPLHSLGRLEDLIEQIAWIQESPDVQIEKRCALIFCGDHGVVAEGISQSGSEVTALVARSIVSGTANINLMASVARADVFAVDVGMMKDVPGIIQRKIASGTRNMAKEAAMTREQAQQALQVGIKLVDEMKAKGYQLITVGEMGIGNTTASAAMACALMGSDPCLMTGRGAGLSDTGLMRKRSAIRKALELNQPDPGDAVDILAKVGGFEIAAMAGAFLGGAAYRMPIVMDGVISAVSALTAVRINPDTRGFILPSHMSREPAMIRIMEEMDMHPVIHGDMALGEGTGAVAILPLLDMALKIFNGPHTFEELGMDAYQPQHTNKQADN